MFSIIENTHIFEENANKLELFILFGHFNFVKKTALFVLFSLTKFH
jgi:hypothetical protein